MVCEYHPSNETVFTDYVNYAEVFAVESHYCQ